MDIFV